jgi:hypothetical protein
MFPDNLDCSKAILFTKLNKLGLLEAAEMECLRLYPLIGYAMPRGTPLGGGCHLRVVYPRRRCGRSAGSNDWASPHGVPLAPEMEPGAVV